MRATLLAAALAAAAFLLGSVPAHASLAERAERLHRAGEHRRAAELLAAQARRAPNDPAVHLMLARAYLAAGEHQRSALAAQVTSTLERDPIAFWRKKLQESLERERLIEALVAARELARLAPDDCEQLALAAHVEERTGNNGRAEEYLRDASSHCPEDADLRIAWGGALLGVGCWSEAATVLARIGERSGDAEVIELVALARAVAATHLGAVDGELATLEEEVTRSRGLGDPAQAATVDARFRDILAALDRLEHEYPGTPEIELRLAELYRLGDEIGLEEALERALARVRRALELRQAWPRALVLLGTLELSVEPARPAAAEHAFLQALSAPGERPLPAIWSGLFFAYLMQGRPEQAREAADIYLKLVPEDRDMAELRERALGIFEP